MTETASTRASFVIGDEAAARRVTDLLGESFDDGELAIAAFERPDRSWEVSLHFGEMPNLDGVRALVAQAAGDAAAAAMTVESIAAKDWVAASLEGLVPVPAGRFVVHGSHDRARIPSNKLGIEIEAALAFGTGHHGTTRGCLTLLDLVLRAGPPRSVLDLGTGTGVLAIAAAKALRQPVLATDIDRQSVAVAKENARLNGVGNLVEAVHATGFSAPVFAAWGPFDLVLANILANPLRQLSTPMSQHLAPSALVILSGLLQPQAQSVIAAYRARGCVLLRQIVIEGWSSLLLAKTF
ncbi:50S ribosomal protein L11 methyltransferase [Rhodopseudomonas pseudopalustris]|uniref:Ribosomal protein L11 methyltransferase n=2 Tax=Rhodopseudomonas TaxID=1073 RepID=PRMA_RHOPS|nr:50S ribosomal protein L11 methyltransferase [Rhodopseudomonas pseudopalustris]Q133Y8.1 RecName: Full=Ribosomal protein L11 methyltransferase; Short=L11 Mtase [Rhodopseudomonas palustris BisB5]ABE40601.1 LSU ribosomal protein L11P methyltransferase [Rhodopseudomonas palustris BisB5]SEO52123.1 [LSU ribosomal protein L11P]-lysine N-methyltransferase [Rhodopseudomonas pseudopalustris]